MKGFGAEALGNPTLFVSRFTFHILSFTVLESASNRLWKNSIYAEKSTVILRMAMAQERLAGCSKWPSSKAAGGARTGGVPSGYVEDSCEMRTKLAGFFSILPARSTPGAQAAAHKRLAQCRGGRKAERYSRNRGYQSSGKTRFIFRWGCSRRTRGGRGFGL